MLLRGAAARRQALLLERCDDGCCFEALLLERCDDGCCDDGCGGAARRWSKRVDATARPGDKGASS